MRRDDVGDVSGAALQWRARECNDVVLLEMSEKMRTYEA
jgi:hypothetical protein